LEFFCIREKFLNKEVKSMKKILILLLVVSTSLMLGSAGKATAATFVDGDIFAAVNNGNVQHYSAAGVLLETLNTGQGGFTTGMAFDSSGNLYVTNFSANSVTQFAGAGDPHTSSLFGSGYSTPESIVFDGAGNVYVGNLGNGILKFDSAGNFLGTVINTRVDWMDLAADGITMLYTQEGHDIKTVNVNTGVSGANFTTGTASQAFALRILSDGGVLLADLSDVKRYNSAGAVIQTYDIMGENTWFSLNLNPDGTSFWSGNFGTGMAYEFDITSGANTQSINTGVGTDNLYGLTIFGETTVITPEPGMLVLLGSGLIGLVFARKRMKK